MVDRFSRSGVWENRLTDDYLRRIAEDDPERLAVVDRARTWSYGALNSAVDRLANALLRHGIHRGEVISWQLPNWTEALIVHHAALRIGAVSNPIIPIYRHTEVQFILTQTQSRILFIPASFRGFDFPGMVADLRADLPHLESVVVVGGGSYDNTLDFSALLDCADDQVPAVERDPNDVALLLYTSGTTSAPKGTLHTHNTLDYENRSIIDFYALSETDVVFMPSPVGHITGILYGMQLPFILGSSVVLQDVWEPGRALQLIERHRCSFALAATPFLHALIHHRGLRNHDLGSLRVFACGGADVAPGLIKQATADLGCMVSRIYGSTEFPTATGSNADDALDKRAHTDGRPIGMAEVRIIGADGNDVPRGVSGEVVLRGPELFVGYFDETLNASVFTSDGWFLTGDLAVLDSDGFLEIVGRRKDIIIRGGENISAKEIEDHLSEHPKIADVAVVAMPDPVMVERVCAVVVTEDHARLELSEITTWLRDRQIAIQKIPEHLVLTSELPRTASGKVQKFRLREQLRNRVG
jgi:cyclohexanecarboxylate-CoA ligase